MEQKISLKDTKEVKCKQCGHIAFNPCFLMREVNQFLVGSSSKNFSPIEVFECTRCHQILEDTMPNDLRTDVKPSLLK